MNKPQGEFHDDEILGEIPLLYIWAEENIAVTRKSLFENVCGHGHRTLASQSRTPVSNLTVVDLSRWWVLDVMGQRDAIPAYGKFEKFDKHTTKETGQTNLFRDCRWSCWHDVTSHRDRGFKHTGFAQTPDFALSSNIRLV